MHNILIISLFVCNIAIKQTKKQKFPYYHYRKDAHSFLDEELAIKSAKKQRKYSGFYPHTITEFDRETKAELLNQMEINYEKQNLLRILECDNKYKMEGNMNCPMKMLGMLSRLSEDKHPYIPSFESGGLFRDFDTVF
jgi:hypothetical protein